MERAGANVTVVYRGSDYSPSVKPWILPEFESLVKSGEIKMHFESEVVKITETSVTIEQDGKKIHLQNDFVFAMTGYHPNHSFLTEMGIVIDGKSGCPMYNEETMESNIKGLYIAGVIAAGNDANEIFIENGRFHGIQIANAIVKST